MTHDANLAPTLAQNSGQSAFDATQAAPSLGGPASQFTPPSSLARTTVLPRVDGDGALIQLSLRERSRYEPTKLLGAGGMGEVVLSNDHDIERKVAVKRLLPEMTDPLTLARFVDEIRCVGRLEHPNIVPIHDVGVDELGRYFFVMKYVEGETLESVIEKLAAGDPAYVRKYTTEVRVEIFLGLLHALQYAHERGIVHRDIKPANVMIGRYGEVVLMDWGIAKPLGETRDTAKGPDATLSNESGAQGERARMYATRVGSLIGTPAYMSPEQARGEIDKIDVRSDLYSACVLFHELLGLRHYLADRTTLESLLEGVTSQKTEFSCTQLMSLKYPGVAPPAEYAHLTAKGLRKDPAQRYQSAGELIDLVERIMSGKVPVQCPITFTKRSAREMGRVVDRWPFFGFFMLIGLVATILFAAGALVRMGMS
jgi:serine/threonine-protein kinase